MDPLIDSEYSSGRYFEDRRRHEEDAEFKARNFAELFKRVAARRGLRVDSYADVGCGSGAAARNVARLLAGQGIVLKSVKGYDVSPHVREMHVEGVELVHGGLDQSRERVDLATLFDVFEHVSDPLGFIGRMSGRCDILGFHIPLDASANVGIRDLFRVKLENPGHLLFMDAAWALNLLTLSGLRVVDYEYTLNFLAPSARRGRWRSRLALPLRTLLAKISPWLVSKTLGGVSLMVVALTPSGVEKYGGAVPGSRSVPGTKRSGAR
ncbi:MAG: methyltransferase domain-containing protein [Elusimicrobia bacterium]|nr:methyltransferase domain-containing protein [Elusimicrobiota bacterium]